MLNNKRENKTETKTETEKTINKPLKPLKNYNGTSSHYNKNKI